MIGLVALLIGYGIYQTAFAAKETGCMCVVTIDGKKYWQWENGDLDPDPNLTHGQVVATTAPGHCYNTTKEGETCVSGGMISIH